MVVVVLLAVVPPLLLLLGSLHQFPHMDSGPMGVEGRRPLLPSRAHNHQLKGLLFHRQVAVPVVKFPLAAAEVVALELFL
jgi:hypothetical protein